MSTKIRWDISKEEGEKLSDEDKVETTEEEDNHIEEEEARSRIPYDPLLNECDLRKRRVTDIQENSRIYMPKPLNVAHEANINIRETIFENTFSRYVDSFCNETGKQKPNLTRSEMSGLAKRKKRVDDGSVVICETDKSGKLAIVSMEEYIRMGQVHIEKDLEIDQEEVDRKERLLNGHTSEISVKLGV